MTSTIIVAILGFLGTAVGSICGVFASAKLTTYRIEQLEKKVEKHNNFIERLYIAEGKINALEDRQKDLDADVDALKAVKA